MLTFTLDRTDANREIWKPLLYDPLEMRYDTLHLSTGLRGGVPALVAPDADNTLELDKIWIDSSTILWTLGFMVLFVAALYLGSRTDLLREGPARGGRRQAFSLGRVQMAWWFVLTVGAFLLIWVLTGDRDTIPTSILTLLGISAATALAAQQVTPGVVGRAAALQAKADAEAEALAKALDTITQRLAALGPMPAAESGETAPPPDPIRERLVAAQARLTAERQEALLKITEVDLSMPTRGFWRDIVSNELGVIALDRLQIVVWTLVLGGVFIHSVRFYLTIPEFNSTLLLLQGISSGTYVGFKFPTARST